MASDTALALCWPPPPTGQRLRPAGRTDRNRSSSRQHGKASQEARKPPVSGQPAGRTAEQAKAKLRAQEAMNDWPRQFTCTRQASGLETLFYWLVALFLCRLVVAVLLVPLLLNHEPQHRRRRRRQQLNKALKLLLLGSDSSSHRREHEHAVDSLAQNPSLAAAQRE